tara:strand:- start:20876 stop:21709 length:834 start_codon:yes stop_codon:yes gene_type:complete
MKHTWKITTALLGLFLLAQLIGLVIINNYVTYDITIKEGEKVVKKNWEALPYEIERPEFEEETSYIPIIILILVATGIILLLVKLKAFLFWKAWFFLSVWFCLIIAFGAFLQELYAVVLAFILAILKIFKRNMVLHNLTELFIYGGIAAIFVPILNLLGVSILLILISIYDFIAVHKTKHMVSLAKFQTKSKLFAGLYIPYGKKKTAILGGGDIAFPLMFTAVVLGIHGISALIITLTSTLGLAYLFWKSEKGKYYPAMPFITAGCFVGYFVIRLIL